MQTNIILTQPYANCVYQRDNSGKALIPIVGTAPVGTANVVAVFTAVRNGMTLTQTLPVDMQGNISASIELLGGLYSLDVWSGTLRASVNRVGAGEVFALYGHSFLQGGHDLTHQLPAQDERVFTLLDTMETGGFRYGRLTDKVGPFHPYPDWTAPFGDLLVQKLGVPVLIYGAAYGGSNILQSYELLKGVTRTSFPPGFDNAIPANRQPFLPIERVMATYVPKTGIRALLVEHGYNDRGATKEQFKSRFQYVMDYIRNTYQKPKLAIVLVQEELTTGDFLFADPATGAAQTELIASYPNTFKGPDFNNPYWPPLHIATQNEHMFGASIDQFGKDWANSLTPGFFAGSTPYGPVNLPDEVFPAVLFNAPMEAVKTVDWLLLAGAAVVLVGIIFWKNKYLIWAFLLLGLIALGRVSGKV